tara:strand:- start:1283 stop:2095 length:813 start_codon:yes stop_codon:yes gene_type:complete
VKKSKLDKRSIRLRELIILGLEGGKRGHVGSSMSLVEILRVLYDHILNFDIKNLNSPKRDRLILSKGHGCLALYSLLVDKGIVNIKHLRKFCMPGSILGGHPDDSIPGVEAITGSLGHGLSIGIGMAIGLKIKKSKSKVYVIVGDGEMNEGSIWEGLMSASKHRLNNLVVIIDNNNLQTYGTPKEVAGLGEIKTKIKSFGFETKTINGHSLKDLKIALKKKRQTKPLAIICKTVKGMGIDFAENNLHWHHKSSLSKELISNLKISLKKNK